MVSMRSICASSRVRAGVSSGAPYHHFADREALLASIAEEGFGYLEAAMIKERDAAPDDATSRLAALGRAYVSFATTHRGHFRVMFRGNLRSPQLVQRKAAGISVAVGRH